MYCIVPNTNLRGLPKHLNGHARVSEQNLIPQNMVWRTREASRPPGNPTLKDHGFTKPHTTRGRKGDSHPPDPTPRGGARREGDSHPQDPTPQGGEGGRGIPNQPHHNPHHRKGGRLPRPFWGGGGGAAERVTIYVYIYIYIHLSIYLRTYIYMYIQIRTISL